MMEVEVEVKDPQSAMLLVQHDLRPDFVHCNLEPQYCCCRVFVAGEQMPADIWDHDTIRVMLPEDPRSGVVQKPPNLTGSTCSACGGMMMRTGSCETCTECATTGGCG